jgi:hypothetical protein
MHIAQYKIKYAHSSSNKQLRIPIDRINSTKKWVEYSLDIHDMLKLLMLTRDIDEKYTLMHSLDVAQRKRDWHCRQHNFNLYHASTVLDAALKAYKIT